MPEFRWESRALRVSWRGASWRIDPESFAGNTGVTLNAIEQEFAVTLERAIIPGTHLRADLRARIYRVASGWRIALAFPALGIIGDLGLLDWLRGAPISADKGARRLRLGSAWVKLPRSNFAASTGSGFTLEIGCGEGRLHWRDRLSCHGSGVVLTPRRPSAEGEMLIRFARDAIPRRPSTEFSLLDPRAIDGHVLHFAHRALASFVPRSIQALTGSLYAGRTGAAAALLAEGTGTLRIEAAQAGESQSIELERSAAVIAGDDLGVAGQPRPGQYVDLGGMSGRVAEGGEEPIVVTGRHGRRAAVEIDLVWLPLRSGDVATLDLSAVRPRLALVESQTFATDLPTETAVVPAQNPDTRAFEEPQSEPGASAADAGPDETVAGELRNPGSVLGPFDRRVPLQGARLLIRRGADLAVLTYRFVGFDLRRDADGTPYIDRNDVPDEAVRIIVEFPPQHIWETVPDKPEGCSAAPAWDIRARMARTSRIAFRPKPGAWRNRRISIERLTDWTELQLLVDERAKADLDKGVEEQLALPGLDEGTGMAEAFRSIAERFVPPAQDMTALEVASRLILSPSERAAWEPQSHGAARGQPLWNIRLNAAGRQSVRAIWSSYFTAGRLPKDFAQNTRPLTATNHWDIVGQTSVYGLPALRRIEPDEGLPDPVKDSLRRVPRGGVVVPKPAPQYLADVDAVQGTPGDTGVAVATTFNDADISLTAYGAIVDALWEDEPARLRPDLDRVKDPELKRIIPQGFSLERLNYLSWLGRDSRVVAVTKGFLFPLGLRASFVVVSERRFYPDPAGPVAYEVQRRFIVTRAGTKSYPGLNQPFDGRDFPPRAVEMRTLVTPDLVDPDPIPDGEKIEAALRRIHAATGAPSFPFASGRPLFWPQVRTADGNAADFEFKWASDSCEAITSPLIFVDNVHVGVEAVMKSLVAYYRSGDVPRRRRTARLDGARHRYADEVADGDTSFDTDNWELDARGQLFGNGGEESYTIDGRMEGAGQPPFYPFVPRAQITIQSLDRMLGQSTGLITVEYFDKFRALGFGHPDHPSEIYLKVLGPRIALDVEGRSQVSGGVASTSALVAAVSRKTGIVGGKDTDKRVSGTRTLMSSVEENGFQFDSAAAGKFSPEEFFGFKMPRLLGIVDLTKAVLGSNALAQAPRLFEKITMGALEEAGGIARVRSAAADAKTALDGLFRDFAALIDAPVGGPVSLKVSDLYPGLKRDFDVARRDIPPALAAISSAATASDIVSEAGTIVRATKPLLKELTRVSRDPLPEAADDVIRRFKGFWETIRTFLSGGRIEIERTLLALVGNELRTVFCSLLDNTGLGPVLFGSSPATGCAAFLDNPADVLATAEDALFAEMLARPVAEVLQLLENLKLVQEKKFALPAERLRQLAVRQLEGAVKAIESRLVPNVPSGDLRDPAVRRDAMRILTAHMSARLQSQFSLATLDTIAERFEDHLLEFLDTELDPLLSAINPIQGVTREELLTEIRAFVAGPLRDAAAAIVRGEVVRVRKLIADEAASLKDKLLARVTAALDRTVKSMIATAEFARIAELGNGLANWCDQASRVVKEIVDGLIATQAELRAAITALIGEVAQFRPDPGLPADVLARIDALKMELLARLADLERLLDDLDAERRNLPAAGSVCAQARNYLDPAMQILRLRAEAVRMLETFATKLAALQRLVEARGEKRSRLAALGPGPLAAIVQPAARLFGQLTSIEGFKPGVAAVASIRTFVQHLGTDPYGREVAEHLETMLGKAAELAAALDATREADQLLLAAAEVRRYADAFDRKLAALVLQSTALTRASTDQLKRSAGQALKAVAAPIAVPHGSLTRGFNDLVTFLNGNARPIVVFVIGASQFAKLEAAAKKMADEDREIQAIANAGNPDAAIAGAKRLQDFWDGRDPAIVSALGVVASFIEDFLNGNLQGALAQRMKGLARDIERRLRELLAQFVPTSIETGYDWDATIQPVLGGLFKMSRQAPDASKPDLRLSARVNVNLATGRRDVVARGELQPFEINLLPSAQMAIIKFRELTFESKNGASPKFSADVLTVEMGPLLKFLKPLQEWMSPKGNGFYLRPAPEWPGLEAGYQFSAGMIGVGALNFYNVALRAAVRLPFGSHAAQCILEVGSEDFPILISSPPYAGGGFLQIIAEPGETTSVSLMIAFGGAAQAKFGPLNAYVHALAKLYVRILPKGVTIAAIFEAVGEGSIACFSISVCLRVSVWHYPEGNMRGETRYSFTFKVGFIKYRYKVTATYKLRNGSAGAAGLLAAGPQAAGPSAHYHVDVPKRERDWAGYQQRIDNSLL